MDVDFRIPMLIRGYSKPGDPGPEIGIYLTEAIVSFPLATGDDASHPRAFDFRSHDLSGDFRLHEGTGRLFDRRGGVSSAARVAQRPASRSRSAMRALYEDILPQYARLAARGDVALYPSRLASHLAVSPADFHDLDSIRPCGDTPADIAAWTGIAAGDIAEAVVIGGTIWKPAVEPLLALKKGANGVWQVKVVTTENGRFDTGSLLFSLDEVDDLLAFQRRASAPQTGRPEFALDLGTYTATRHGCVVDVACLAASVVWSAEAASAAGPQPSGLRQLPTDFVVGYGRLRRFLDMAEADRSEDDADEALDAIVAMAEATDAGPLRRLVPSRKDIAMHVDRWKDRTIRLGDIGAPA